MPSSHQHIRYTNRNAAQGPYPGRRCQHSGWQYPFYHTAPCAFGTPLAAAAHLKRRIGWPGPHTLFGPILSPVVPFAAFQAAMQETLLNCSINTVKHNAAGAIAWIPFVVLQQCPSPPPALSNTSCRNYFRRHEGESAKADRRGLLIDSSYTELTVSLLQPCFASSSARCRPMPEPAPVISAAVPSTFMTSGPAVRQDQISDVATDLIASARMTVECNATPMWLSVSEDCQVSSSLVISMAMWNEPFRVSSLTEPSFAECNNETLQISQH